MAVFLNKYKRIRIRGHKSAIHCIGNLNQLQHKNRIQYAATDRKTRSDVC